MDFSYTTKYKFQSTRREKDSPLMVKHKLEVDGVLGSIPC